MTYIRDWMSSKFGQIRSGTTELAALEHLKNRCCPFFSLYLGKSQVTVYMTIGPLVLIRFVLLRTYLVIAANSVDDKFSFYLYFLL